MVYFTIERWMRDVDKHNEIKSQCAWMKSTTFRAFDLQRTVLIVGWHKILDIQHSQHSRISPSSSKLSINIHADHIIINQLGIIFVVKSFKKSWKNEISTELTVNCHTNNSNHSTNWQWHWKFHGCHLGARPHFISAIFVLF